MARLARAHIYILLFLGIIIYYIWLTADALLLFLAGLLVFGFCIMKFAAKEDRRFLVGMMTAMFLIRFFLSLAVAHSKDGQLSQDEGLYSKKALLKIYTNSSRFDMNEFFYKHFNDYDMRFPNYGYNTYTNMLAKFYWFFGYQVQAARLINTMLCILAFFAVFYLTKELTDAKYARIASSVFAFFPSIMLWSVMISVDLVVILGILIFMLSLAKMKSHNFLWCAIPMAAAVVSIYYIRPYIAFALVLSLGLVVIYRILSSLTFAGIAALALVLTAAFSPLIYKVKFPVQKFNEKVIYLVQRQYDFARIDDSGYFIYPKHCYRQEYFKISDLAFGYAKGLGYVLFSPFPWAITSNLQLMAYPQSMFWYLMIPFCLIGIAKGIKTKRAVHLVLIVFLAVVYSIFSLAEGNVGALFRHKDMIMPCFMIFFVIGLREVLCRYRQPGMELTT